MGIIIAPGVEAAIELDCHKEPRVLHLRAREAMSTELFSFFASLGEAHRFTPTFYWVEVPGLCKLYVNADRIVRIIFRKQVDRRTIYEFLAHCGAILHGRESTFRYSPPSTTEPCQTPIFTTC